METDARSHRDRVHIGRTLPLFEPVSSALLDLYTRANAERHAAGPAYAADLDAGYLAADELGEPLGIERYSDEFARLCAVAGLPKCRLHDTRRAVNSLLEKLGVSDSLRAAWLGHTIAINRSAYLGAPRPEELAVISDALSKIFKVA